MRNRKSGTMFLALIVGLFLLPGFHVSLLLAQEASTGTGSPSMSLDRFQPPNEKATNGTESAIQNGSPSAAGNEPVTDDSAGSGNPWHVEMNTSAGTGTQPDSSTMTSSGTTTDSSATTDTAPNTDPSTVSDAGITTSSAGTTDSGTDSGPRTTTDPATMTDTGSETSSGTATDTETSTETTTDTATAPESAPSGDPATGSDPETSTGSETGSNGNPPVKPPPKPPQPEVPHLVAQPDPKHLEEVSQETGIPVRELSTDYSPEHVVSTVISTTRSGGCTTYNLMYSRSEDVFKTLTALFQKDVDGGELAMAENSVTNSITVRVKDPNNPVAQEILDVIKSADFRQVQVLIDVLVVELKVNNRDLFDFELKSLIANPMNTKQTTMTNTLDHGTIEQDDPSLVNTGLKTLVLSQNKFKLFLNAVKSLDKLNVLSSPHIVAVNHRPATFKIGDKVPIIQSIRPSDAGPIKTFEIKDVGIELTVTPHINRSGQIDMEVFQTVNNLLAYNETEGTAQMSNREVKTNIIVGCGETLILGGFIEEKETVVQSHIPILSQIPVIGKVFRKSDKKKNKTEMLVFLTPRIIDTKEEARGVTEFHTKRLSFGEHVKKVLAERSYKPPELPSSTVVLIEKASRDWRYDFDTVQAEVLVWQVPPKLALDKLNLKRFGACPFGYGPSKRLSNPFIRTYLKPADGFIFQKEFMIENPATFRTVELSVASKNAAAVYLNGVLVDEDPAVKLKDGHDYEYWNRVQDRIPSQLLRAGKNNIVVLLGNDKSATGGYFDMMLVGHR